MQGMDGNTQTRVDKDHAPFKVLITTSGIGSRLGELTQFTNKSLVSIGDKPAISYIIESYPASVTFVVTLGYFGQHVKEFLTIGYPQRKFEFVSVDNFDGPGSSLAHSLIQARNFLQLPFIYHACDTLVLEELIPPPLTNWIAGYRGNDASNYASFDTHDNFVTRIYPKGSLDFDYIHIGIIGINDFTLFWDTLESIIQKYPNDQSLNDVSALNILINQNVRFKFISIDKWYDSGNSNSLKSARKKLKSRLNILEKASESIYFMDNSVVKFYADADIVSKRVERSMHLRGLIPSIEAQTEHFYRYKYEIGNIASEAIGVDRISNLLEWAKKNLWITNLNLNQELFKNNCRKFYIDKSKFRVNEFFRTRGIRDVETRINEILVPSANALIDLSENLILSHCLETGFHGDFILDNILVQGENFKLLDWRQDFADSTQYGDIYYDLAKLNHSLYINHKMINDNFFSIKEIEGQIECDLYRSNNHVNMQGNLKNFARDNNLLWSKIKVLTGLIWLNMSPLHHGPFDKFLYFFGRYYLWKALNEIEQ